MSSPEKKPSFVMAVKNYFEMPANTAVTEFKALTQKDKIELSEMLQPIYPHEPYAPKAE